MDTHPISILMVTKLKGGGFAIRPIKAVKRGRR
jgi:hypothetical protein